LNVYICFFFPFIFNTSLTNFYDVYALLFNIYIQCKTELLRKLSEFKKTSVGSALYMHPKLKYFSEKYPANGERGSAVDDKKIDATLEQVDVKEGAEVKFFPQFTGPV